jgi:hypothetical protein
MKNNILQNKRQQQLKSEKVTNGSPENEGGPGRINTLQTFSPIVLP